MTVRMTAVDPDIVEAAIAETKAWLRIEMGADDAALASLCRSAIGMAEDFCAQRMFRRTGTEVMNASREWRRLESCPVVAMTAVRVLKTDGTISPLPSEAYAIDIGGDGDGWIRVADTGVSGRIEVDLVAGMAAAWQDLPTALQQGIVRLAAHLFRESEATAPPAIVTALWRPWRRMRLR